MNYLVVSFHVSSQDVLFARYTYDICVELPYNYGLVRTAKTGVKADGANLFATRIHVNFYSLYCSTQARNIILRRWEVHIVK